MYYEFTVSIMEDYGITEDPILPTGVSFQSGTIIDQPLAEPMLFPTDTTVENPPPDYTTMIIPVMSNRLVAEFREYGVNNLQTFRSVLENQQNGEQWEGYQAVNIVGLVDCANMRKSKYSNIGGGLVSFRKLVVNASSAAGALLFRLPQAPELILIHERIRDSILSYEPPLTGFDFKPVTTR